MTDQDRIDCETHWDVTDQDEKILELEEKVDNLETEKEALELKNYDLELIITNLLEQQIKDKTRKACTYAKLANGDAFKDKDTEWYLERKQVIESEIDGHKKTIEQVRSK